MNKVINIFYYKKLDSERRNNCFICSLEKTIFEKEGIFFEEHTEN